MFRILCLLGLILSASVSVAQQQPPSRQAVAPAIQPDKTPPPTTFTRIDEIVIKKNASIMTMLEYLSRKAEVGNSKLAAVPVNEWLKNKICGCNLQVSGKVASLVPQPNMKTQVVLADQVETWRQSIFSASISGTCAAAAVTASKLHPGDDVTLKGIVEKMAIDSGIPGGRATSAPQQGLITLRLKDCRLIAAESESPAVPTGGISGLTVKTLATSESPGQSASQESGVHIRELQPPPASVKPEALIEVVATSANDMEIRRMEVPGGWLVFTKWLVAPGRSQMTSVFYPNPSHSWDVRSSPMKGTVKKGTSAVSGSQPAATSPLRPLGAELHGRPERHHPAAGNARWRLGHRGKRGDEVTSGRRNRATIGRCWPIRRRVKTERGRLARTPKRRKLVSRLRTRAAFLMADGQ